MMELRNKLWKQINKEEFEKARKKKDYGIFIDTQWNELTYFKLVRILNRKGTLLTGVNKK